MARTCTVCAHPAHHRLNKLVVEGQESLRSIARRHGLSKDALIRHRDAHLPKALVKAQEAREVAHGEDLLGRVDHLRERAVGLLDQAEAQGDIRAATSAIREARCCLELIGKATGELVERHAHLHANVGRDPERGQALMETLQKLTEAYERARPIIHERMMRHVFEGKDAVPTALVGDRRK